MDIFDKWSQQSKHYNKKDNAKYIRSLKTSSNGRTRRTLFKMLKEDDITYFKQIREGQKRNIEQQAEFIDFDDALELNNIEEVKEIDNKYLYNENDKDENNSRASSLGSKASLERAKPSRISSTLLNENQKFKIGMAFIDIFTKYAVVVPIRSKQIPDFLAGSMECLTKMRKKPTFTYSDEEGACNF